MYATAVTAAANRVVILLLIQIDSTIDGVTDNIDRRLHKIYNNNN